MKYLPFIFENQDVKATVANNEVIVEAASKQIINMNILLEDYIYNNLQQFINYGSDLTDIYENIKNFVVNTNVNNYLLFSEVLASTQLSNEEKLTCLYETSWAHIIAHGVPGLIKNKSDEAVDYLTARFGKKSPLTPPTPSNSMTAQLTEYLKQSNATKHTAAPKTEAPAAPKTEAPAAPKTEAPTTTPKPKGKLRGALIKTGLVGGGVTGAVELTKAAYNVGLEHPKNNHVNSSNSSTPAPTAATNKTSAPATSTDAPKVYKHNPWATDSSGHVSGTKYSPDQYKQHLVNKYGVERANAAIARASGPGWTPQSLNK